MKRCWATFMVLSSRSTLLCCESETIARLVKKDETFLWERYSDSWRFFSLREVFYFSFRKNRHFYISLVKLAWTNYLFRWWIISSFLLSLIIISISFLFCLQARIQEILLLRRSIAFVVLAVLKVLLLLFKLCDIYFPS